MIKKLNAHVIVVKERRSGEIMSGSSEKKDKNNIKNNIYLNQINIKYILESWENM